MTAENSFDETMFLPSIEEKKVLLKKCTFFEKAFPHFSLISIFF
jgi:hypothetical protein